MSCWYPSAGGCKRGASQSRTRTCGNTRSERLEAAGIFVARSRARRGGQPPGGVPMAIEQRPIRDTGVTVSEIGFGVWTVAAGWWGSFTRDEAAALIREAYDLGITFFNTSNAY